MADPARIGALAARRGFGVRGRGKAREGVVLVVVGEGQGLEQRAGKQLGRCGGGSFVPVCAQKKLALVGERKVGLARREGRAACCKGALRWI